MTITPIDPLETNTNIKTYPRHWKLPNGIQLIGISGHAGSGKDELAKLIYSTYTETYSERFADPLKEACAHAFGMPLSDFHSSEYKEISDPYWGVSPRMIAQFIGSELFRDHVWRLLPNDQNDFWVRRMWGKLSGLQRHQDDGDYEVGDTVVIPDVRFQNEIDFITDNDGVHIHLIREGADGKVGLENHQSESQNFSLAGGNTYVIKNDGTLEDLFERVKSLLSEKLTLTAYTVADNL